MLKTDPKKTLVLGASTNPSRYANIAALRLMSAGYPVALIGARAGKIYDIPILTDKADLTDIHTVTVYLSILHQREYYEYLLKLNPERVIFNPGAENPELERLLSKNSIQYLRACTLVLLSTGQY